MRLEKRGKYFYLIESYLGQKVQLYCGSSPSELSNYVTSLQHHLHEKILASSGYQYFHSLLRPAYQTKLSYVLYRLIELYVTTKGTQVNDFVIDFVYNSNRSEGSRIAKEEFINVIEKKKTSNSNKNDILEVKNSFKLLDFLQDGFIWNQSSIKKSYHILTKGLLQEDGSAYPRGYKKIAIIVGNDITTAPEQVTEAMNALLSRYKTQKKALFPLQSAIEFHWRFERIHPFENGNGRIGRMLMNKILMDNNMTPLTIYAENRVAYFHAIEKSSLEYMIPLYEFIIDQYEKTLGL